MPLPADYHMHTPLCRHAVGEPTELAAHARRVGLTEIGFSEHNPMVRDDWDDWHMLQGSFDTYLEKVDQARRDHPSLSIKIALEMDFIPGQEAWIQQLASRHPWDYLIGAVHYVSDSWDLDNPKRISEWKTRDPFLVWKTYFERLTLAAESGFFQIIAHADLCKKFCFYPKEDCAPLFRRFLEAVKRNGLAMELNTAGLRKDCREIYPSPQIVRMAAEMEVPITFASDAHAPSEVGADFEQAVALARSAGYTHYCRFTQRQREMVKL
ncbi:MAG TPA: histidinol-phosphatase HisJ family protein [Verrucomicrobiae bacterium]|jgi:histidinol-phosphatase (PHP family)|nr:histidinol-phosphatase HisJ family protein [Verrucomicrobiae bacterium]